MGKPVIKLFDKIIVILLGFFGICSSCNIATEYGEPYADYEVKGVITNKENAQPIENIRVIQGSWDTIYTDAEGKYAFRYGDVLFDHFHLKVEDIDGEENGGDFATREIELKITEADRVRKGDGKWYEGKYEKIENVELELKEINHEETGK